MNNTVVNVAIFLPLLLLLFLPLSMLNSVQVYKQKADPNFFNLKSILSHYILLKYISFHLCDVQIGRIENICLLEQQEQQ